MKNYFYLDRHACELLVNPNNEWEGTVTHWYLGYFGLIMFDPWKKTYRRTAHGNAVLQESRFGEFPEGMRVDLEDVVQATCNDIAQNLTLIPG